MRSEEDFVAVRCPVCTKCCCSAAGLGERSAEARSSRAFSSAAAAAVGGAEAAPRRKLTAHVAEVASTKASVRASASELQQTALARVIEKEYLVAKRTRWRR